MSALLLHVLHKNRAYHGIHSFKSFRQLIPLFAMPKNREYLPDLQKNRIKLREKKGKYSSGTAYLQILGSGAKGAPKSVYFFSDFCRYMFNCGEGTQRLAHEHKIKIARLEHIFVTHPCWNNIGGLPGLALTVQEVGVPDITLHGPSGLECLFAYTNRFVVLNNLAIKMAECSASSIYDDPTVTIQYVPLLCKESSPDNESEEYASLLSKANSSQDDTDYYAYMKGKNQLDKSPQKFSTNFKTTKFTSLAMNYICKLKPKLGTLNLDACVEYGVPPGPLLGKLKNGEDVVLPDGKPVKSTDVKYPDCPGPVFIIVDCPSVDYLDSLLNEEKFKEYQIGAVEENLPKYILHFTPSHVISEERYQSWMKRFPDSNVHINVNDSNTCMGNVGVHYLARQLNYLDSEIFPLLADQSIPIVDVPLNKKLSYDPDDVLERCKRRVTDRGEGEQYIPAEKLNIPSHVGHTLKVLDLRDTKKIETQFAHCVYMNPQSIIEDLYKMEGFESMYNTLKSNLAAISDQVKAENDKNPYPIITFLGTGSSIPNKSRNTSGILITLSHDSHIILDCGEGTYGQIVRFFGADEAERILASTEAIYVSHLHADHHIGAINLLQKRREAVKKFDTKRKKVYFIAPKQILFWFFSYHFRFESILDCLELISNQDLLLSGKEIPADVNAMLKELNVKEIKTCKVRHCPHSFGVSITDSNDKKITYSGDTMPVDSLVELGKDSDLLIHEATFEDGLSNEARIKMHSTTCEAIQVGRRMNAKFTILTHFSQRYYKIPVITEHFDDKVGIAFDNMRVRFGDFKKLPLFNDILKIVFSEEQELLESRIKKRKRKLEIS